MNINRNRTWLCGAFACAFFSITIIYGLSPSEARRLPAPQRSPLKASRSLASTPPLPLVKFDENGNGIDAHDGELLKFGDTYYWYGTSYGCGFEWKNTESPFCGFKVYSSKDLVNWKD